MTYVHIFRDSLWEENKQHLLSQDTRGNRKQYSHKWPQTIVFGVRTRYLVGIQQETDTQKDWLNGVNERTSYRGVTRLRKATRESETPRTNSSRKFMLLLGLMRAKGRSGVIGPSKLCSPGRGAGAVCGQGQNRRKLGEGGDGDKYPSLSFFLLTKLLLMAPAGQSPQEARG